MNKCVTMKTLKTIFVVLSMLVSGVVAAQHSSIEKQTEIKRLAEQSLKETNLLLDGNFKEMRSSEKGLKLIRNRIGAQRVIVQSLRKQVGDLEREIDATTRRKNELEGKLAALKKEYGEFVYAEWKNRKKNNATAFLLSAKDFNTAARRLSLLRSYNRARVDMGVTIDSLSGVLQADIDTMNHKKAELEGVKTQRDKEMALLSNDEQKHNSSLKDLQKNRRELEAKAKKERETIAAAQKAIDRIIAEQAKVARGERTQADVVLTGRFEDNKGLMPWPVGGPGTVLDHFGANRMADGIIKNSSGLSIAAHRGAEVKALFDGEVTGVYSIGQFGRCVTVRSGSYIVLYGNLAATSLKSGDNVAINHSIGRLSDTADADNHMLLLQIWHETTPLDPEEWLRR